MSKKNSPFRLLAALIVPAGIVAAPAMAAAQGFQCGANNPLTQDTRAKVSRFDEDRKTESKSLDRDRIEMALAKAGKKTGGLAR